MTPAEYLAFDRASDVKHEYAGGEVFAMAGATSEHNLIVANVVGELRNELRRRPCNVYPSDMRVLIPATERYTYPDASVVCGEPLFTDDVRDTLRNPKVILEVLSDSTEAYDRGEKFRQYRTIDTLADYVLVSQNQVLVEHYRRQADGTWILRELKAGGRLVLESVGCAVSVDELYLKVFGDPPSPA
jgi:Uma2 family endonuclease